MSYQISVTWRGSLNRYAKLWVAHAPGMPGTFSPPPRLRDPDMHRGTCVTHVPWGMSGSLIIGFLWKWWRRKRSQYSRRMRNRLFCVSGKRPMAVIFGILVSVMSCRLFGAKPFPREKPDKISTIAFVINFSFNQQYIFSDRQIYLSVPSYTIHFTMYYIKPIWINSLLACYREVRPSS